MTGLADNRAEGRAAAGIVDPRMLLAVTLFVVVAVAGVLIRPLLPIDETRYLTVAWEMYLGHDWLVPHLNGHAYSDKPPLLFWLINLVWLFTGPSELAARLVAPFFGLLTMLATARLGARLHPQHPEYGGWAALILSGSLGFALFGGLTMFDTMLAFATVTGVLALSHVGQDRLRPWLFFGLVLGLGALAKGPVVLIHLLPVAVSTVYWRGIGVRAMLRGVAVGLGVGLAVVALWLVPALLVGSAEYREAILWTQSAGRVMKSFAHQRPFWFFFAMLPLLLWPWAWSPRIWREARFVQPLPVWIGVTVLLFSLISGKQAHYLVPVLPAFAIAFAPALAGGLVRLRLASLVPGAMALAICAIILGLGPSDYALLASPVPVALLVAGLLLAAAALTWAEGLAMTLAAPMIVLALACIFLGRMGETHDATPLARRLAAHDQQGIGLVESKYHGQFGFAGRLRHPVSVFEDAQAGLAWLQQCPGRVLVAPVENVPQPPSDTIDFRGSPWGLWLPGETPQPSGEAATCP